jgi:hypothetical protein
MKQKMDREIRVRVQDNLYDEFSKKCEQEFKTVSIVVRELMARYIDKDRLETKRKLERRLEKLEDAKLQLIVQNPGFKTVALKSTEIYDNL